MLVLPAPLDTITAAINRANIGVWAHMNEMCEQWMIEALGLFVCFCKEIYTRHLISYLFLAFVCLFKMCLHHVEFNLTLSNRMTNMIRVSCKILKLFANPGKQIKWRIIFDLTFVPNFLLVTIVCSSPISGMVSLLRHNKLFHKHTKTCKMNIRLKRVCHNYLRDCLCCSTL